MEFVDFYNNGLHIYRVWKVPNTDASDGSYKLLYEQWI